MKSIFEEVAYNEILERLNVLTKDAVPKWGKMNVSQMLSHCQEPLKVVLGKSDLKRPNIFMRLFVKSFKSSIYNDKPWKANLPTLKEFQIVDKKDFEVEKNALIVLVKELHERKDTQEWPIHPVFGKFTPEQWGKAQYKHLDHHLRQFNVA